VNDGRSYPDDLPRHSVSVGAAVIRDDGRVLAIKRADNGAWVQPGGVVELDEDPRDAVRQVLEETGVHIEPMALTGVYKNMKRGSRAIWRGNQANDGRPLAGVIQGRPGSRASRPSSSAPMCVKGG
jgi:8-oxo-dGTP pyrophosphatase MutT (NUDIX family)